MENAELNEREGRAISEYYTRAFKTLITKTD